jgi:hypothetical protein
MESRVSAVTGRSARVGGMARWSWLVGLLAVVLFLCVVSGARAANFNWYWYNGGSENCWQTGSLGAGSQGCDFVGAGFLEVPGRLEVAAGPHGEGGRELQIATSGDYCGYYGLGDTLNKQDSANLSGVTGFGTPAPYGSYNEWDGNGDACQANAQGFGEEIARSECTLKTCGMHHFVSFHEQGSSDRPWSKAFGSPSLVVSTEATVQTLSGASAKAWGYVCPLFQDTTGPHDILEYCLQEWRGPGNATPEWQDERIGSCAGVGTTPFDTVQTFFYSGTRFAENLGPATTGVATAGWNKYSARITEANLKNAIELDRKAKKEKAGNGSGEFTPELGTGCERTGESELSTNPANYALIGVEQGAEGWGFTQLGAGAYGLQLHTEYTPLPPEATTNSASGVSEEQGTLNGSANPRRTDTHYHFQYGETTAYGSSTSEFDAGSGEGFVSASPATVTGLQPGITYHYRLVANSEGGTVYGNDQTFTTPSAPSTIFDGNGTQYVATEGANHALYVAVESGGKWSGPYPETAVERVYSAPSATSDAYGDIFWTFEGREHDLEVVVRIPEKEGHPAKIEGPFPEAPAGKVYSAPSAGRDSAGNLYWSYEGVEHDFEVLVRIAEREGHPAEIKGPYPEAAPGSDYSGPATSVMDAKGNFYWLFAGANTTLNVLERLATGEVSAIQKIGGEGTTD